MKVFSDLILGHGIGININQQNHNNKKQYFFVINKIVSGQYMQALNHSRKTSLEYQLVSPLNVCRDDNQLCFVRSLKESPQTDKMFWLRATHHERNERYHSDEKSNERPKARKQNLPGKKVDQLISNHHVAKPKPLLKFANICLQSALYVVQTAIKQCASYHQRLGCSHFDIRNCYVDEKGKLAINSHSPYQAYTPVSDETIIVRDIIESVHKICAPRCFDDFYSYYKRSSAKNKCGFKYALSLIQSYCMCSKISILSFIKCEDPTQPQHPERSEHPRSAERVSPFAATLLPSLLSRRKSSSKTNRESFYVKLFDNRSQQKMENRKGQEPKKAMKPLHVISIQHQYSVVVNPVMESMSKCNANSEVKMSTASTNFKSSHHHGDPLEISSVILRNRLSRVSNRTIENKEMFSFLPPDLDEVQSLGQSSDQESHMPTRRFETPRDTHQENIKKQNEERILTINNWTRRLNGLLEEERDLKLSINEEMNKENYRLGADQEGLRKMVRTVAESILPIPSQFLIRNS